MAGRTVDEERAAGSAGMIVTERLIIRPFAEEHLVPAYVDWLNDSTVVRYSEQRHQRHTLGSCREYWQLIQDSRHYLWAIEVKERPPRFVGTVSATIDSANRVAEIGILIGDRAAWGSGYGLEAWQAVCQWLLVQAGMRKVFAGTLSTHTAMLAIMRRSGMRPDGRWRRHALWEGREVDFVYMALFREDYDS